MSEHKYADELRATAKALGRGILAADESTGTIKKRFDAIGLECTLENRVAYRTLLAEADGVEKHIGGVILFDETIRNAAIVSAFRAKGVVVGIKTDRGCQPLPGGAAGESFTAGVDHELAKRSAEYYALGARFCKYRCVLLVGDRTGPTEHAVQACANTLAAYSRISQDNGLAPIWEPEILMDGNHSIEDKQAATERVLSACVAALHRHGVLLEGTLLKPAMCLPGSDFPGRDKVPAADVGRATVTALRRTLPPAVPTVCFLSGGQSEEEATRNLAAVNQYAQRTGGAPWNLTFSYGRALQASVIKTWGGKAENVAAAQAVLIKRASANADATLGKYDGGSGGDGESLFVKDYKY